MKSTFHKVHRSCKQLNEVNRSGKAPHEVRKICKQLYEIRRIRQQLYEVRGTRKQLLSNSQKLRITFKSLWDSPIIFWKVHKAQKNFMKFADWKTGFNSLKVFLLFKFHSFKCFNW